MAYTVHNSLEIHGERWIWTALSRNEFDRHRSLCSNRRAESFAVGLASIFMAYWCIRSISVTELTSDDEGP